MEGEGVIMSSIREQIELIQPYDKIYTFTKKLTDDDSSVLVDISKYMVECNRITFLIDDAATYVRFVEEGDEDEEIDRGNEDNVDAVLFNETEGYFDDNVRLKGKIVARNATDGETPRIRGILWGRG